MKFCPHCGTTFEQNARFCLECGFDRSTVEPVEPLISLGSQIAAEEIETAPPAPTEINISQPEAKPGCPECGNTLDPADRFCQECGFDTTQIAITRQEIPQPEPLVEVEEIIAPPVPVEEPVSPFVGRQFCSRCGTVIAPDERFCQECGYDTASEMGSVNKAFEPVEQPIEILRAEPGNISPETENVPPLLTEDKREPEITAPAVNTKTQAFATPILTAEPVAKPKGKKTWLRTLLIILGLGVLAVAGWYGYDAYMGKQGATTSDTISDMALPPVAETDTLNTEMMEQPEETAPEQPVVTTKPLSKIDQELARQKAKTTAKPASKIDQELARQKAKEQNKTAQGVSVPDPKTKVDPNANDNLAKVILEVGRKEEPKNKNPKNPTRLIIQRPTMIVRITTDHYNKGMGTANGGSITLKDANGNVIATFRAYGRTGTNGTPNAKWVAEPHKVLVAGTYYIWDSEFSTWSKTFLGSGFVVVEGYEVE